MTQESQWPRQDRSSDFLTPHWCCFYPKDRVPLLSQWQPWFPCVLFYPTQSKITPNGLISLQARESFCFHKVNLWPQLWPKAQPQPQTHPPSTLSALEKACWENRLLFLALAMHVWPLSKATKTFFCAYFLALYRVHITKAKCFAEKSIVFQ